MVKMVEVYTQYTDWILTLLLYLIHVLIFSQTTRFLSRSCRKQLSDDRQRTVAACNHFLSTTKRAAFISQLGFLEVCAGLVVVTEAASVKFHNERSEAEKEACDGHYQCPNKLHYVSCLIVGCLFLSIVRCLAQRFVLGRLSRSDIISMTRIYLVPATCIVTVLCVLSWFRLLENRERIESDKMTACCSVIQAFPMNLFWLFLLPIFWDVVVDYLEYRKGRARLTLAYFGSQATAEDDFKSDKTPLEQRTLVSETVHYQDQSVPALSTTTEPGNRKEKEIADTQPELSKIIPLSVRDSITSGGIQPVQISDKTAKTSSAFDSFRDFLIIYTRFYSALAIYLAALMGVYAFLANCHTLSGTEDYTPAVFMTILVMTGILRGTQITVAELKNNDGLKGEKVSQMDV